MKRIVLSVIMILAIQFAFAQPPAGKATPGTVYGAATSADNAIPVSELPALLKKKDTLAIKVKGKVLSSCVNKGCWMVLQVNDSTTAFVKMKDYAFFVPTDIAGKTVVLDGVSYVRTTSVAEQKHYAEDAKKSKSAIESINKPKSEIRLMANGILVVE